MALDDRVPIPPKDVMNPGLTSASAVLMQKKFGVPGKLTKDCSDPTGKFKKRIKSGVDVGPFKVSGLDFAVESLIQIFTEVKQHMPDVFTAVKTAPRRGRTQDSPDAEPHGHYFGTNTEVLPVSLALGYSAGCLSMKSGLRRCHPVIAGDDPEDMPDRLHDPTNRIARIVATRECLSC
jgi:hypothetical protein